MSPTTVAPARRPTPAGAPRGSCPWGKRPRPPSLAPMQSHWPFANHPRQPHPQPRGLPARPPREPPAPETLPEACPAQQIHVKSRSCHTGPETRPGKSQKLGGWPRPAVPKLAVQQSPGANTPRCWARPRASGSASGGPETAFLTRSQGVDAAGRAALRTTGLGHPGNRRPAAAADRTLQSSPLTSRGAPPVRGAVSWAPATRQDTGKHLASAASF